MSANLVVIVGLLLLVFILFVEADGTYNELTILLLLLLLLLPPWDGDISGSRHIHPPPIPNALLNSNGREN